MHGKHFPHPDITLCDVPQIPDFHVNLLSVSQLTKGLRCSFTFHPHFCVIQDQHGDQIGGGEWCDGLYILGVDGNNIPHTFATTTSPTTLDLWHQRLGHPAPSTLRFFNLLYPCIPKTSQLPCMTCPLSIQCHTPFTLSNNKSTTPFQLIHMDIWGKSRLPTHQGFRYFLIIVDDFTRTTWAFLLINKFETHLKFKQFVFDVKNQHGHYVRAVRRDNGTKFTSA